MRLPRLKNVFINSVIGVGVAGLLAFQFNVEPHWAVIAGATWLGLAGGPKEGIIASAVAGASVGYIALNVMSLGAPAALIAAVSVTAGLLSATLGDKLGEKVASALYTDQDQTTDETQSRTNEQINDSKPLMYTLAGLTAGAVGLLPGVGVADSIAVIDNNVTGIAKGAFDFVATGLATTAVFAGCIETFQKGMNAYIDWRQAGIRGLAKEAGGGLGFFTFGAVGGGATYLTATANQEQLPLIGLGVAAVTAVSALFAFRSNKKDAPAAALPAENPAPQAPAPQ